MTGYEYALVTPARNEAKFIANTIESVVSQTVRPKKWVIISDGSTDGTDEIVSSFAKEHEFICFVRVSGSGKRSFSSKVNAFKASYEQLTDVQFDYVGNLDADITLAPNYFEKVMQRFQANSRLGIGGGIIQELVNDKFTEQRISLNSVAGAVQMFRRHCYEEIGGYIPLRFGGVDSAAEIVARMHGWEVRTFSELGVHHHRPVGSGAGGIIKANFRYGRSHYSLGYHPLFELLRCSYKLADRPFVIGSLLMVCGYLWSFATREEKELPEEAVRYLRSEQIGRLRTLRLERAAAASGKGNGR